MQEVIKQAARLWRINRGEPSYPRIGKAMKKLVPERGARQVLLAWEGYLEDRQDRWAAPEDFVNNYEVYRRRWAVEIGETGEVREIPNEEVA